MKFNSVNKNKYFKRNYDENYNRRFRSCQKKHFFRKPKRNTRPTLETVNPRDPLNLLELEKQQEQRINMGLSPLPGDSAFNTPIITTESNNNDSLENDDLDFIKILPEGPWRSTKNRYSLNMFYNNTNPEERLKYFLPDWFDQSNICEYGCHRGDFAFKLFELFHMKIRKLDCIDVRKNCILNAKHLQREKHRCEMIRRMTSRSHDIINYNKINFKVGNWVKDNETCVYNDGCEYDIIIALGVTKLIHLYYGDIGLEKFLRRACHRLKPGGHLIVELQTKSKYIKAVREIAKAFIVKNFKNIKIPPDKLEPLLASVGFPYCCKINTKQWDKTDQCDILLCTKPIGTTPVPIRDTNTTELMLKYSYQEVGCQQSLIVNPPPVVYNPGTTAHISVNSRTSSVSPPYTDEGQQFPDSTIND